MEILTIDSQNELKTIVHVKNTVEFTCTIVFWSILGLHRGHLHRNYRMDSLSWEATKTKVILFSGNF